MEATLHHPQDFKHCRINTFSRVLSRARVLPKERGTFFFGWSLWEFFWSEVETHIVVFFENQTDQRGGWVV